jgi:hypothetical protein
MNARLLLRVAIVIAATSAAASAQTVRPESLTYMSRLFRMKELDKPMHPRYSRDGRWLAFDAGMTGTDPRHIYVVAAAGGTPTRITTGKHNDVVPTWSAAGDRLVYASDQTGGVMTIAIDPATGGAAGPPKRVTVDSVPAWAFDVAPDGKSVAYLTRAVSNKFDLRIVPINGGPSRALATEQGNPGLLRFDRTGEHIYFVVERLEGTPRKGFNARDVKRIATSDVAPSTVFTIPEGLMGLGIDPIADRVIVRDGDHARVLTFGGDSVATIDWTQEMRMEQLAFTPDGSSIVTWLDATRNSIHLVPLDGGPVRVVTDSSGTPWPDYWIGDHIFIRENGRVSGHDMLSIDGKVTAINPDLRKANDGVPMTVGVSDPFADGIHQIVRAVDAAGDTSLFVYDPRTGDARRVARKVTGTRGIGVAGDVESNSFRFGNGFLYHTVKNGVIDIHLVDVSGRERVILSVPQTKTWQTVAFGPGRIAHGYERGDTAFLDVTIGSASPVHVLVRPGTRIGEVVFNADGSSLYADVITGTRATSRNRGGFFSTLDAQSLSRPPRWTDVLHCWHPTWLPNGAGVLEFCTNDTSTRTWVSRLSATGAATPQPMTQRETAVFWDYAMSPDGKYVAVPAESNAGMVLWRIDLRGAKQQARRR